MDVRNRNEPLRDKVDDFCFESSKDLDQPHSRASAQSDKNL